MSLAAISSGPQHSLSNLSSVRNLVFIDSGVENPEILLQGVVSGTEAHLLRSEQDAVQQITEVLANYADVARIHIIAHGTPGSLQLGSSELNLETLKHYEPQLRTWFNPKGTINGSQLGLPELLLYGCNVAAGKTGAEFLEVLQQITGANLFASATKVGSAQQGGDWQLQGLQVGGQPQLAFTSELMESYTGVFEQLNAIDYAALKALYEGTNGEDWNDNTGWFDANFSSVEPPNTSVVENWYGVTIEGDRVTEITLPNNNLSGEIPARLGSLTNLKNLDFSNNRLTGEVPAALSGLTSIEDLDLDDNLLSGKIPTGLSTLDNLQNLNLDGNRLFGEVPEALQTKIDNDEFGFVDLNNPPHIEGLPFPFDPRDVLFPDEIFLGTDDEFPIPLEIPSLENVLIIEEETLIPITVSDLDQEGNEDPSNFELAIFDVRNWTLFDDIEIIGDGADRSLRITPAEGQEGISRITIGISGTQEDGENNLFSFEVGINGSPEIELLTQSPRLVFETIDGGEGGDSIFSEGAIFEDQLFLSYGEEGDRELWRFDGETVEVAADINPNGSSSPYELTVFNDELFFGARDEEGDRELWSFDGATATVATNLNEEGSSDISELTVFNDQLLFNASFGIERNLWSFDGETAVPVTDTNGNEIFDPQPLTVFNDELYFLVDGAEGGSELWSFDGETAEFAAEIEDEIGNFRYFYSYDSAVFNDELYFAIDGAEGGGSELWRFDGETLESVIELNSNYGSPISELTVFDDKLYFVAEGEGDFAFDGGEGLIFNGGEGFWGPTRELWSFDGIEAEQITDLGNALGDTLGIDGAEGYTSNLTLFDDQLFFTHTANAYGIGGFFLHSEIWSYDGEELQLKLLSDNSDNLANSSYEAFTGLTAFQDELYIDTYRLNLEQEEFSSSLRVLEDFVLSPIENEPVEQAIKVADVVVLDDELGDNIVTISGANADLFELSEDESELFLKAGTVVDFEETPELTVTVNVDDPTLGDGIDDEQTFTLDVIDVNEAPVLNPELSDQEVIENEALNLAIPNNRFLDRDAEDSLTYGATLADGSDLPTWLRFNADTQTFSGTPGTSDLGLLEIQVTATDTGELSVSDTFQLNVVAAEAPETPVIEPSNPVEEPTSEVTPEPTPEPTSEVAPEVTPEPTPEPTLEPIGDRPFNLALSQGRGGTVNELIVVTTDAEGRVDGILPGAAGFEEALIANAKVVFSSLKEGRLPGLTPERTLELDSDSSLQFAVIENGSLDSLRNGSGGSLRLAAPANRADGSTIVTAGELQNPATELELQVQLANGETSTFGVNSSPSDREPPIGSGLQGQGGNESELLDFRNEVGTRTATFEVFRDAVFDNLVGFYFVENEQGQVRDSLGALLNPGDAGYTEAALANRLPEVSLSGTNNQVETLTTEIEMGRLLSTFIIVNGTVEQLLDENVGNDPNIYFTHLGANGDRNDHVRLIGDNTFGFEDLAGGGDLDFDDIVVRTTIA